jgi:ADP-heptose:LPS heptosyltransferase
VSPANYVFRKKHLSALAGAADALGRVVLPRKNRAAPSAPKKILLVRLDHLGDVLQATGIPQLLKEHFPSAEVIFLTSEAGAALLVNNPYVDEVIRFDARWFDRKGETPSGPGFLKLASELRRRDIDLGLSLRGDARENLLLAMGRVRYKIGYGITGGGFLLDRELHYRREAHESQHSLDILRVLGIRRDYLLPSLFFSAEEEARVDHLVAQAGDRLPVGVQLDAGTAAKRWPESNRAAFLDAAFESLPGARFIFFGRDPVIRGWLDGRLRKHDPASAENLMGKTSARELVVRLKACRLFVGPDSGPSHLAAALNIPTLILYSGTNIFEKWKPLAENADILRNPVPCAPCHLTECPVEGHPCMSGIRPDSVVRWLKERDHAS